MIEGTSLGRQLDILHRSMDASLLRQNVIANNIANANTPNFKRSDLNFESRLAYALESSARKPRFQERTTHDRHIPFHKPLDYRDVRPRRVLDFATTAKNNGNNVDIDVESMDLLNSQLAYQMMTRSVADSFARINLILR
ncbi:flagellar biosynthesis protein FlgB [Alkalispirochaeta sphaeroplastigenens]|uniref:Flagellar basal body rod protein FlgB n=1 Tax=Alkalispirochaeta sphaeroplastigenens TaxID=1187066 RepID=A0A2S4JYY4_9SPIO|nr:flagellar basal body rod protein FlgB [Alkalispirochaeta sphaeroplastigenens]POR04730.1 flagellar biosynthesis protein FlgB [Alkalispirochaeta sphaeroplastigenens]